MQVLIKFAYLSKALIKASRVFVGFRGAFETNLGHCIMLEILSFPYDIIPMPMFGLCS